MDKEQSFATKLVHLVALILLAVASLGALGIGIAFSAGAWTKGGLEEDVQNVVRVMAGVFGAFAITAAAELVLARKRDQRVANRLAALTEAVQGVESSIRPGVDAVLKNRD